MKPVAFITGASRGIGASTAQALAKEGYNLALTARSKQSLQELANQCEAFGAETFILPADIRDRSAIQTGLKLILDKFGKINVLFVNHGMTIPNTDFVDDKLDAWEEIIDVNLKAAMSITRIFLPHIIATSKKEPNSTAILFLASVAGKTGYGQMAAYCASKFGLLGFAQALFSEVQRFGIKVSSICPGFVNTDMAAQVTNTVDFQKMIQLEDISKIIVDLINTPASVCVNEVILLPQQLQRP